MDLRGSGRPWIDTTDGTTLVETAVLAHLATALAHGAVHLSLPVPVATWQYVVAGVFVFAGPLAGLSLLRSGRRRSGGIVLAATFSVALAFELLAHFVVENPDHVGRVVHGRRAFEWTAALAVLTDAVGVGAGALCWRRSREVS